VQTSYWAFKLYCINIDLTRRQASQRFVPEGQLDSTWHEVPGKMRKDPRPGGTIDRTRPYSRSEVIHNPGSKAFFSAFERERPRIVNNFAVKRVARLRIFVLFTQMNWTRLSNLAMRLE
jgi:hypothetical protein